MYWTLRSKREAAQVRFVWPDSICFFLEIERFPNFGESTLDKAISLMILFQAVALGVCTESANAFGSPH